MALCDILISMHALQTSVLFKSYTSSVSETVHICDLFPYRMHFRICIFTYWSQHRHKLTFTRSCCLMTNSAVATGWSFKHLFLGNISQAISLSWPSCVRRVRSGVSGPFWQLLYLGRYFALQKPRTHCFLAWQMSSKYSLKCQASEQACYQGKF